MQGRTERTEFCESNDVREKDGHRLKMFWFHGPSSYELFSNEAETREKNSYLTVSYSCCLLQTPPYKVILVDPFASLA